MEPSRGQHHLLTISLLVLVSGARIAGAAEPRCEAPPPDPCDSQFLSSIIGESCPANLDQRPTEHCCVGVVAAVGILFGDTVEVPCLCRVAKERYLAIMGLDIYSITVSCACTPSAAVSFPSDPRPPRPAKAGSESRETEMLSDYIYTWGLSRLLL